VLSVIHGASVVLYPNISIHWSRIRTGVPVIPVCECQVHSQKPDWPYDGYKKFCWQKRRGKKKSKNWRSNVQHTQTQCPTYTKAMSNIHKSDVQHTRKRCPTYTKAMSNIHKSDVQHTQKLCPTYTKAMSNIHKSDVQHTQNSTWT
jgi:hypothetical protein